ncbi:MAG: thiol-disulfide oxidoreductase DCC family protein [Bacteroidetes bacterium]|nr:thiol-disulfide oxidoreductase DCC family protein [Bacteroidota bacterium]
MEVNEPVLLFDGVCNFCNTMVNFAIRNDKKRRLRFAPLQSTTGELLRNQYGVSPDTDTIVFIEKGKAHTYARAAIRVCKYLDWPARLLYAFIIVPDFISRPVYKWIARNRYKWFGKRETCMIPTAEVRSRFLE